jgi:hypothetical protein
MRRGEPTLCADTADMAETAELRLGAIAIGSLPMRASRTGDGGTVECAEGVAKRSSGEAGADAWGVWKGEDVGETAPVSTVNGGRLGDDTEVTIGGRTAAGGGARGAGSWGRGGVAGREEMGSGCEFMRGFGLSMMVGSGRSVGSFGGVVLALPLSALWGSARSCATLALGSGVGWRTLWGLLSSAPSLRLMRDPRCSSVRSLCSASGSTLTSTPGGVPGVWGPEIVLRRFWRKRDGIEVTGPAAGWSAFVGVPVQIYSCRRGSGRRTELGCVGGGVNAEGCLGTWAG